MILVWLLVILGAGAMLAWLAGRWNDVACRWIALLALVTDFVLVIGIWAAQPGSAVSPGGPWIAQVQLPWIPQFGISFHLAADGLSLVLLALTLFLGIMATAASWREIQDRVGFFHVNLLLTLMGIVGVFTALDLFLFYFFWELMLVPMYFLIILWGHENRVRAGLKFFIFTQAGGLFMLISILAMYFMNGSASGVYSFNYDALLHSAAQNQTYAFWLMLGFFAAFGVKLPIVPLHVWLPDAHTEAPTAGSVILSGLMLKTGAYGFLRFLTPFFPQVAATIATAAFVLAVVGVLYGAVLAFAQTDLKRYIAYSSISHMGFVLLGVYAWNPLALQGVVIVILAHGLSTSALFIMAGSFQERMKTRDLDKIGGLWEALPRMGGVALFFALASLGLPGLANFVGEFLILLGAYQANRPFTVLAASGLVLSAVYSLWLVQRTFHGQPRQPLLGNIVDLGLREMTVFSCFIAAIVWIGIYPQPVIRAVQPALEALEREATMPALPVRPADASADDAGEAASEILSSAGALSDEE